MPLYLEISVDQINDLKKRSEKVKMSINDYIISVLFDRPPKTLKKDEDNTSSITA